MAWIYPISLAVISVAVAVAERVWPWRSDQKGLRRWIWSDLLHLVFNGHFLGVIFYGIATRWILPLVDPHLPFTAVATPLPLWAQIPLALFITDFIHWCVHNLLHRVPFLWPLHKTHHSVKPGEMDWIVSFRFQWTEVVVYKTLQYLPLAILGFRFEAVMVHAVFGTLIGHINHANLKIDYGPLRYLLNNPVMHLWHHDYAGDSKTTKNFGIIFSCWDYIFGTASVPDHPPERIGFPGDETFPKDFFNQVIYPIPLRGVPGALLGASMIAGAWVLAH